MMSFEMLSTCIPGSMLKCINRAYFNVTVLSTTLALALLLILKYMYVWFAAESY